MPLEIQTIIDIILVTLAYCVSVLVVPNAARKKPDTPVYCLYSVRQCLSGQYRLFDLFAAYSRKTFFIPVYDHSAFFPLDADQPSGNPTFLSDPFYEYLTFFSW